MLPRAINTAITAEGMVTFEKSVGDSMEDPLTSRLRVANLRKKEYHLNVETLQKKGKKAATTAARRKRFQKGKLRFWRRCSQNLQHLQQSNQLT